MTHFKMPLKQWEGGGLDRIEYYQLYDVFNVKTHRQWIDRVLRIQKFFGLNDRIHLVFLFFTAEMLG